MTKKKYKSGKLTPMTERILVDALILWQQEFIKVIKTQDDGQDIYVARHKQTGVVHATISGKRNTTSGTYTVHTADSTGEGPKVHKVYRKIMQSGHSKTLVGKTHSPGGQKIWQSLSKERGVSVHGWHHGKAHNIDTRDSEDTHVPDTEARAGHLKHDPAGKTQYKMKLVASLHKRKTAK